MGSGLPNNMSSEGRGMHEAATSMRCKWGFWLILKCRMSLLG
jgi:hypothetical protein